MSARNERFNAGMVSMDWIDEEFDPSKDPRQSDGGLGVCRMVEACDFNWSAEREAWRTELGQRNASVVGSVLRLIWDEKPFLARVLVLIFEHGENRRLSIRKVPMSTYFRARNALLEIFVGV